VLRWALAARVRSVNYEGWSHFQEGRDAIERRLATAPAATREAFRFLPLGTATDVAV
jgi:hypothetical protein